MRQRATATLLKLPILSTDKMVAQDSADDGAVWAEKLKLDPGNIPALDKPIHFGEDEASRDKPETS